MKKILRGYTNRVAPTLLILGLLVIVPPLLDLNIKAAPLAGPSVSVSPDSGLAGSTVTVSGSGFTGGYNAVIRWDGVDQVNFTMPKGGSFSSPLKIPSSAAPGPHTISVCNNCGGGEFEENASVGFKVIEPPTKTHTPQPPPVVTLTPQPPAITSTPKVTPTATEVSSICEDLGLGADAKALTFDPYDPNYLDTYETMFGVRFSYSMEVAIPPVAPHSDELAAKSIEGEFGSAMQPIRMFFARPLKALGVFVGIDRPEKTYAEVSAILSVFGYQEGGRDLIELGSDTITFPPGPSDIIYCLRFMAEEGDLIARAELEYVDGEGESAFEVRWMDDLTMVFIEGGILPVAHFPIVEITSPEDGAQIYSDVIDVRADITEDVELDEVWYRVNGSARRPLGFSNYPGEPTRYFTGIGLTIAELILDSDNEVVIGATNSEGNVGSDRVVFRFIGPTPTPSLDLMIYNIEITQGIQHLEGPPTRGDLDNSIPLYEGKPTLLRVYVRAEGTTTEVPRISGYLCRSPDPYTDSTDEWVTSSCISSNNRVGVTTTDDPVRDFRGDLSRTINFNVPPDWITSTEPTGLMVEINRDMANVPECCLENNRQRRFIIPERGRQLDIVLVRVKSGRRCCTPSLEDGFSALSYLSAVYPTSRIRIWSWNGNRAFTAYHDYDREPGRDGGCGPGWSDLLDDLWWMVFWSTDPVDYLRYYGMVHDNTPHGSNNGCAPTPGDEAAGIVGTTTWPDLAGITMAHEIGHSHGLHHAPGCGAGNPDDHFPTGTDASGNVDRPIINEWGIDVRDSGNLIVHPPNDTYDFMGYCGGSGTVSADGVSSGGIWVSPYTYENLGRNIHRVAGGGEIGSPHALLSPDYQDTSDVLVGSVRVSAGAAEVRHGFYRMPLPADEELPLGDSGLYTIELIDDSGMSLIRRKFDPVETDGMSDPQEGILHIIIPMKPDAAEIVISREGNTLLNIPISANSPTVEIISPSDGDHWSSTSMQTIEWESSDLDGDTLIYILQYSIDGGQTWSSLEIGITDTSYKLDVSELAGSDSAKIRVMVTDGVNTASDESDGSFTVDKKGPQVYIASPEDGLISPTSEQIIFQGFAIDYEDGYVEESSFVWTSDQDGTIGIGSTLWAVSLSEGKHLITLTITDKDGMQASESISIAIGSEEAAEGAKPFPGEIFVDQPKLSVPPCTPNGATFTAYISDPQVAPKSATLLVSLSEETPMIVLPMDRDELGLYIAKLEVEENAPVGEWRFAVEVVDESGTNYRSELGTLPVNACGVEVSESQLIDQLLQLIPYLAIGLLVVAVAGLMILAVLRFRARGRLR